MSAIIRRRISSQLRAESEKTYPCRILRQPKHRREGLKEQLAKRACVRRGGTLRTEDGDEDDENSGSNTHVCGRGGTRSSRGTKYCEENAKPDLSVRLKYNKKGLRECFASLE